MNEEIKYDYESVILIIRAHGEIIVPLGSSKFFLYTECYGGSMKNE